MNLTSFLNKVDQTIEKYGREELLQVIHEIARTLRSTLSRVTFFHCHV